MPQILQDQWWFRHLQSAKHVRGLYFPGPTKTKSVEPIWWIWNPLQPEWNISDSYSRRASAVQKRATLGIDRPPEFEIHPIESTGSKAIPSAGFGRVDWTGCFDAQNRRFDEVIRAWAKLARYESIETKKASVNWLFVVLPGFEPGTRGFSVRCSTNWAIVPLRVAKDSLNFLEFHATWKSCFYRKLSEVFWRAGNALNSAEMSIGVRKNETNNKGPLAIWQSCRYIRSVRVDIEECFAHMLLNELLTKFVASCVNCYASS